MSMEFVFVVGFPRSGTTLLADMIGRITDFPVTPESRFYEENLFIGENKRDKVLKQLSRKIRIKDFEIDLEESIAGNKLKKSEVFFQLLTAFSNKYSNNLGVIEKSPIHSFYIDILKRDFPDSKIIAIVRDPFYSIKSLKKTPWNKKSTLWLQLDWNYRNRMLVNNRNIDMIVRYEDLLSDAFQVLQKMMLEITGSFDSQKIHKAITGSRSSTAVPDWEKEWKSNVNGPLIIDNQEQDKLVLKYINPELASHFGYDQYQKNRIWSFTIQLFSSITIGGYRMIRKVYYYSQVYRLLGRRGEGEAI